MVNNLKFSILLPVHNGGDHIKLCVQSIMAQSYTNFELLILENCSTDGTFEWLQSLKNEKIKLFPSFELLDIQENWKRILAIPKQEYMTMIGHDDLLFPDFLEKIVELIDNNPSANLYNTHFSFIDAKGAFIKNCKPMPSAFNNLNFLESILNVSTDIIGTGYVMKSADYNRIGGFPIYPAFLYCDFELWYKLISNGKMVVSPNTCFSFRIHNNTSRSSAMIKFTSSLSTFVNFVERISKNDKDIKVIVKRDAKFFLLFHCKGLTHLLIKTKIDKNAEYVSVNNIINFTKFWYNKLTDLNDINPLELKSIKAAKIINENNFLQKIYLTFRKIYKKPLL